VVAISFYKILTSRCKAELKFAIAALLAEYSESLITVLRLVAELILTICPEFLSYI